MADVLALRNTVTATQCQRLLLWLKLEKPITAEIAFREFGIARLAARIQDLRDAGHVIHTKSITVLNRDGQKCRVGEYWLVRAA